MPKSVVHIAWQITCRTAIFGRVFRPLGVVSRRAASGWNWEKTDGAVFAIESSEAGWEDGGRILALALSGRQAPRHRRGDELVQSDVDRAGVDWGMMWFWLSAATMVLTATVHSILGEKRLIGPILALDSDVTNRPLARKVLRFAWHFTSILMIVSALVVAWPGTPSRLVAIIGSIWVVVGLFDAVYTKGQHVGWPFLSGAGFLALLGVVF